MTIQISAVMPEKKFLSEADPSNDTWVMIKPITYRDDMLRGELLKERETLNSPGGQAMKGINMYRLRAEELWLTYVDAHIVLEDAEGNKTEPFKPCEEMTRAQFMEALASLPTQVVLEWYTRMLEVNQDWAFPF